MQRMREGIRTRWIFGVLVALVVFDTTIAVTGFFFPQLWFDAFHGVDYVDPQGLLRRCAANWAAFALFQALALLRWKQRPGWLLIVAGVRFSDVFTDLTYYVFAEDKTPLALTLLLAPVLNVWLGVFFAGCHRRIVHGLAGRPPSPSP